MKIKYFDYLRVVAILAVIFLHSVSHYSDLFGQIDFMDWVKVSAVNSFLRFSVPVFFMVSGALNLNTEKSFDLKKRVWKIFVPLFMWSVIYSAYQYILYPETSEFTLWSFIKRPAFYHLWFVYILLGLYLLTPFIRRFITDSKLVRNFLIIWLIWSVIIPTINVFVDVIPYLNIDLYGGFIGWYILGYYLHHNFRAKIDSIWLILGYIISSSAVFCGVYILTISDLQNNHAFYSNLNLFVAIQSICIFLLFKSAEENLKLNAVIKKLSDASFLLYFSHALILEILYGFNLISTDLLLNAITIATITFVSLSIIFIILKFIKLNSVITDYFQFALSLIVIIYVSYLGYFSFFIPNINLNFEKLTLSAEKLREIDHLYLGGLQDPNQKDLQFFNLDIHNQEGVLRIALAPGILESYSPEVRCMLYVPDSRDSNRNIKYTKFSEASNLSLYSISDTEIFSQLICEDAKEIKLRFNKLDRIYLFYY